MKSVQPPRVTRHLLTGWDIDGDTWVEVREMRVAEAAVRDRELAQLIVEHGPTTSREIYDLSNAARLITECWLSFGASNLELETRNVDEQITKAEPLFWAGMTEREFRRNFGLLPVDLALEWHAIVLVVNPQWRIQEA